MKLTGSEIADTPEIKVKLIQQIFTRRMLTCVFLGLASGFPLYVLIQLVPAWLRTELLYVRRQRRLELHGRLQRPMRGGIGRV